MRIPKGVRAGIVSVRQSKTDIPTLVCAAAMGPGGVRLVMGARPARAMIAAEGVDPDAPTAVFEEITQRVPLGSNLRASEAYRRKVAPVLLQRAARACVEGNHDD